MASRPRTATDADYLLVEQRSSPLRRVDSNVILKVEFIFYLFLLFFLNILCEKQNSNKQKNK